MKAMLINELGQIKEHSLPLKLTDIPIPVAKSGEVLIKVIVCGVCHTELDEIEGRTSPGSLPLVPGHQVVGKVEAVGPEVTKLKQGDRVGVAWIYSACGSCDFCQSGRENLCQKFRATGRDAHGGYAEFMKAPEDFVYKIPESLSDLQAAPLLCAGAIGYRALRLTGLQNGKNLGLTGFGASAHLVMKMVTYQYPDTKVLVFARSEKERQFALQLGASWAGNIEEPPPLQLEAMIDTTPVWLPVLEALKCLKPGGRLVVNAIRKERFDQDILLELDYGTHLWMEKEIKSVANITRSDVKEFLELAAEIPIKPQVQEYALRDANQALTELKFEPVKGAKVIRISNG